jgi:hypothetical protein
MGYGFTFIAGSNPVRVSRVERDSPAYQMGLKVGDLIVSVNGETVWNTPDAADRTVTLVHQSKMCMLQVLSKKPKQRTLGDDLAITPTAKYTNNYSDYRKNVGKSANFIDGSPTSIYSAPLNLNASNHNQPISPSERSFTSGVSLSLQHGYSHTPGGACFFIMALHMHCSSEELRHVAAAPAVVVAAAPRYTTLRRSSIKRTAVFDNSPPSCRNRSRLRMVTI